MKEKVLTIVILIAVLSCSFVVFSATLNLENIFLTREEWEPFESSFIATMSDLEINKQSSIQGEVGYQMYRRDILPRDVESKMKEESSGLATLVSWSLRREAELHPSVAPSSP